MLPLADAIRTAPTTRRFRPDPVPAMALERALDLARYAPSAGNRQPWRVVIVADAARRRAIRDAYVPHWDAYLRETGAAQVIARDEPAGTARMLRAADRFARELDAVPVHLVVAGERAGLHAVDDAGMTAGASVYPFVQNLLLALRGEGLGAALVTLAARAEPVLRELLALPGEVAVAGLVAVGFRESDRWPALRREPVSAFAHREQWGAGW
ncbi:MAG: nitroreductase family protein [Solirubrobacterales bacterium]|nr:nitroreductase family protein [Solirubrobacterales bacterium]